jgi:adenylate kinase family enzyme
LNRLDVYTRQTERLIQYYAAQGNVVSVDSSRQRQETVTEILRHVKSLTGS